MEPSTPIDLVALLAHDGFVRAVARGLLFDAHAVDDVVQQTWLAALQSGPSQSGRLSAWLARVTRNLSIKRRVRESRRERRETIVAPPEAVPSVASVVERESLRRTVVDAVLELEPAYRDVMLLRYFENLPPRLVAKRLGLPVETVRTRHRRALEKLRARLDASTGGKRDAWCLGLIPLAAPANSAGLAAGVAATAAACAEIVLMLSTPVKLAAVSVLLLIGGFVFWNSRERTTDPLPNTAAHEPGATDAVAERPKTAATPKAPPGANASPAAVVPLPFRETPQTRPNSAKLTLIVRWTRDGAPAAGVNVWTVAFGQANSSSESPAGRTGADGKLVFENLAPGTVTAHADRSNAYTTIRLESGADVTATLDLPKGIDVDGSVEGVDDRDESNPTFGPVPGADVYMSYATTYERWFHVATADREGRFHLRDVGEGQSFTARAPGYTPAFWEPVKGHSGDRADVTILLQGRKSASLAGRVIDETGTPISGAIVRVGAAAPGRLTVTDGHDCGDFPPMIAQTSAEGRFRVDGLSPRLQSVMVRAVGRGVVRQDVTLGVGEVRTLDMTLSRGWTLTGRVAQADGSPPKDCVVSVGTPGTFECQETRCAADGTFELPGLRPGSASVAVEGRAAGHVSATLSGEDGARVTWNPQLATHASIAGAVRREDGRPVPSAAVRIERPGASGPGAMTEMFTDASGSFGFHGLEDVAFNVRVELDGNLVWSRDGVRPSAERLDVSLEPKDVPSSFVVGRIVTRDGHPVEGADVTVWRDQPAIGQTAHTGASDGAFRVGPLLAGTYWIAITATGGVSLGIPRRNLQRDETWDLGTITLPETGLLKIDATGVSARAAANVRLTVYTRDGVKIESEPDPKLDRAYRLAAGSYSVRVNVPECAPLVVSAEVRAHETTRMSVTPEPGVPCTVTVTAPRADREGPVDLEVKDAAGITVWDLGVFPAANAAAEFAFPLSVGRYELVARNAAGSSATEILEVRATAPEAKAKIALRTRTDH